MTDEKTGLAYDPVRDEDVTIRCHSAHRSTDFDDIDGGSLPVLIESDFRHDPIEACQGTFTEITDISDEPCPNCGYDRATATHHTLAGEHQIKCRACGCSLTYRHNDDWTPSEPIDDIERVKRTQDYIGMTGKNGIKVYRHSDVLVNLIDAYENVTFGVHRRELVALLTMLLREFYDKEDDPLDRPTGQNLIVTACQVIDPPEDDDDEEADDE